VELHEQATGTVQYQLVTTDATNQANVNVRKSHASELQLRAN
jgi:hypothetical protein